MKKSILILIGIILMVVIIILGKYTIEYIATVNKIKNSEIYSKNEFIVEHNDENYIVKIPKGLGNLQIKGNVIYAFKSLKSVDEIKNEFSDLYGKDNVVVENNLYYYKNIDNNYIISVDYDEGVFTDVYILDIMKCE